MAVKISELPSGDTPLTGTEQIPVVQGGTTKAITTQDIVELTGVENKQAVDDDLTGISALTGTGYVKKTGAGTYVVENLVFLTSETDPVFAASAAFVITTTNITNWESAFLWGNHSLAGYQSQLVSGTNIKTVNGESLLGAGDIVASGGSSSIEIGVACSDETTPLTTGTSKVTFRAPTTITLTGVRASLTTAQTSGSTFTVDINVAGSSILSPLTTQRSPQ